MPNSRLLPPADLERLIERVRARAAADPARRVLVGIAGAPGAGKTTLAEDLVAALADGRSVAAAGVAHLPMDGFHLADVQLDALGLRQRKGAPETFDAHGYLATLRRLRSDDAATVYVPGFERELEQPVAAAIALPASAQVVVSEGNYLLVEHEPWPQVRALFDEVWFVDITDHERLRRLVDRHTRFGKDTDAARTWALGPDQANADLVLATRERADLVVVAPDGFPA
ncbi:MAG: nucleoside/nucleotide kinase family protein [Lapillicoccus sp.]